MYHATIEDWLAEDDESCCPDPDPRQIELPFEDDPDAFDVVAAYGYEPRMTPVDTLMAGPVGMHLEVAGAMAG